MQKKGDWNKYKSIFSRFESKHKRLKWGDSIPYNASELETALKEFYSTLNDEEKNFFAINVQHKIKEYFTATNLEPTDSGYDEYLSYLKKARTDRYWKVGEFIEFNNSIFKTDLNEQFFIHTIDYFLIRNNKTQRKFHFLYYVLIESEMLYNQIDYVEYVNKNYNQKIVRIVSTANLTKDANKQEQRLSILNESLKEFNKTHSTIKLKFSNMLV
jgi:hypothetical protein